MGRALLGQEGFYRVLHGKLEVVDTTSLHALEESELIMNIGERGRKIADAFFVIRDGDSGEGRLSSPLEEVGDQTLK